MSFENLLRPGRINRMYMRNRIIVGPMEKSLANLDGSLNERYIAYARRRAMGGAALIQLESTYVSPEGRGNPYQVGCHGDHVIPALTRMVGEIGAHGAKLAMELHHGGRQASVAAHHRHPIAPSAIPSGMMDPGTVPREMTAADIRRVIGDFARAAERCLAAGVDMIHLHGAHGYLLGQFLSPQSNRRTDGYGGSLANRARFPLEVLAAVRQVVGPAYPIGYRISAAEYVKGGLEADESARFAVMLADAGIDLIDVAGGTYESMSKIFQGPEAPKGGFVKEAAVIRRAVGDRVPVSVAQRMNDPVFADRVMEREGFEYVTLARAFHADPDYVRKLNEGRADEILPCIGCNTCVNLTVARTPAGCAANPTSTFELSRDSYRSSPEQVRVMIAGGGVAGMHAARFLGMQGHEVLLYEATDRLGGQLHYLRRVLPDYGMLVDWLACELDRLGVMIETGCPVGVAEVSAVDPDAVVVATGARGGHLWASTEDPTVPIFDVLSALERPQDEWESDVGVIGGDFGACVVAQHLRRSGVRTHVIESKASLATDGAFNGLLLEMDLEADPGVTIHRETTAGTITGDGVVIQSRGKESRLDVGSVVIGGRRPSSELSDELRRSGLAATVYTIGDAVRPRDLYAAGQEAAEVAERIDLAGRAGTLRSTLATPPALG
ncbi:MAG: NAD(P)-binding protein [Acidimicrobiia bacterium]|nr:NAD(P)-binding protein [Acidimicrobiia bacterium]